MSAAWIKFALVGLLLVSAASAATPAPASAPAPAPDNPDYRLHIVCPSTSALQFSTYSRPTCPVRLVDQGQMLGDPSLSVDPLDGNSMAVQMIHGTAGGGPTQKSRYSLPFTTFTSDDAGATWDDGYYSSPEELGNAYGEHTASAVDPYGQFYVGSTYAVGESGRFFYTIGAQKFDSVSTVRSEQTSGDGSYNLEFVDPVFEGARIRQTWFVFNAATDTMTMVWFEDRGASGSGATSADHAPAQHSSVSAIAAALPGYEARRLPSPAVQSNSSAPAPRSTIGVVWTGIGENDTYNRQRLEWSIGPCQDTTNPVLYDGWLYIGCRPDPAQGEFRWNPSARVEAIELFRMEPDGGEPVYMGSSPDLTGTPRLGVRSDGRLSLLVAGVTEQDSLLLKGTFGQYREDQGRITWGDVHSYGDAVTPPGRDERIVRANIQDVMYREYSGVVHLILRETIEPRGLDAIQKTLGPKIRKCIVALDEQRGVLAVHGLDIGNPLNRTDFLLPKDPEMAYEDEVDDLVQLPAAEYSFAGNSLGETYQREFFAVADYGQAMFAEIVEVTPLRFAPVIPPAVEPPPLPAGSPAPSAAPAAIVAMVGAGSLLLTLVAARRTNPVAALAKMKK